MWRDCFKLPDGWTPAQGLEGRGAGGGRVRGRGGRGARGGGAANMKNGDKESESRYDLFLGQFFFVLTQAPAAPEKDEGFEEPAAVGKVTLHSLDYWVIDSGATYSMTPRADLLTELEPSPVKHVTSALGQRAEVKGMGKAMFKGSDGKMVGLKNVLWVPNLAANLISVRRLQKASMDTSSKGAKTYTERLGERILGTFMRIRIVTGRSKKPLELVHIDLVGPLPVQGHKGERYFLTIVDDWGRLMWAYPLKQKDHAATTIREDWLPFVEKQAECVVKRIMTDRGGEFLGAEMTAWLKNQGIQRELTTAYTPQSNGVAEWANRTILETARALLIESGVGNSMWPHAVRHATVARNRVLTKIGNESWVPLERWLGRKPLVDMLRVVGCMAVAHVHKKYRSKLGASAIWCVHLGLAAESKGWLLWEPSKGVLFESRDLDLTPSVWEEGEEAAVEGGDGEKVQEAPAGGGGGAEASGSTSGAAGPEVEQQQGKSMAPTLPQRRKPKGADVAEQQLGNEEALLILPHGNDPDEEDEPAYSFLAPAPEEPASMEEALARPDREKWLVSRDAEYQSLLDNGTWDLVVLPEGKKVVQCKWVLRIKTDDKGQVTIYKSRLVAKGFMQKEKQNFNEIFALTAKLPTLRVLLADAAVSGKIIIHIDVTMAFLNGILEEDVYMTQPPGYEDGTGRVCKLKMSIYSLKQAPRCWYQKLAVVLEEMGFRTSSCDESLFLKGEGEKLVIFLVYVKYYLGMHVERDPDHRWLKLHQEKFIKEQGEKYGIEYEHKVATPMPDISFSVGQLARVVQNPSEEQVDAAERVVKHLNSHPSIGVQYSASAQVKQKGVEVLKEKGEWLGEGKLFLTCFTDATWSSEKEDSLSMGGYICVVGRGPVSWRSKKQLETALSSVESEYIAMFHGVKEFIWLRRLLEEIGQEQKVATPLFCDSKGALGMAKNALKSPFARCPIIYRHFTSTPLPSIHVFLALHSFALLITASKLNPLSRCSSLTSLTLWNPLPSTLSSLASCSSSVRPSLKSLTLHSAKLQSCLAPLASFPHLASLAFLACTINPLELHALARSLHTLTHLTIHDCPLVSSHALTALVEANPALASLSLHGTTYRLFSAPPFRSLLFLSLPSLHALELSGLPSFRPGMLAHCTGLHSLSLKGMPEKLAAPGGGGAEIRSGEGRGGGEREGEGEGGGTMMHQHMSFESFVDLLVRVVQRGGEGGEVGWDVGEGGRWEECEAEEVGRGKGASEATITDDAALARVGTAEPTAEARAVNPRIGERRVYVDVRTAAAVARADLIESSRDVVTLLDMALDCHTAVPSIAHGARMAQAQRQDALSDIKFAIGKIRAGISTWRALRVAASQKIAATEWEDALSEAFAAATTAGEFVDTRSQGSKLRVGVGDGGLARLEDFDGMVLDHDLPADGADGVEGSEDEGEIGGFAAGVDPHACAGTMRMPRETADAAADAADAADAAADADDAADAATDAAGAAANPAGGAADVAGDAGTAGFAAAAGASVVATEAAPADGAVVIGDAAAIAEQTEEEYHSHKKEGCKGS
ncbi:unnamed protein product [Closterium sp. NIES-53]